MSKYIIDEKLGAARQYIHMQDEGRNFKRLEVDKNFFEEYQDYLKINGKKFDLKNDYVKKEAGCVYLITKENLKQPNDCLSNEYIYLDNIDIDIKTLSYYEPFVKLNDVAIIYRDDGFLISNLLIKGNSLEEAKQNIQKVYDKFGVKEKINIESSASDYIIEKAKNNMIDASIALICSFVSIILALSFYAYMLFLKNKNEIMLGQIMGYSLLKGLKKSYFELLITSLMTVMILIFLKISLFSLIIFSNLLLIQIIIIYYNTKKIVKKSIVNYVKGEM